jgi:hypothetical protein
MEGEGMSETFSEPDILIMISFMGDLMEINQNLLREL